MTHCPQLSFLGEELVVTIFVSKYRVKHHFPWLHSHLLTECLRWGSLVNRVWDRRQEDYRRAVLWTTMREWGKKHWSQGRAELQWSHNQGLIQSQRKLRSWHGPSRMSPVEARPLHSHINQSLDEGCPQGRGTLLDVGA